MVRSFGETTKTDFKVRVRGGRALLLASALLAAPPCASAWAQPAPDAQSRLGAIEQKLQALKAELKALKARAAAREQQLKAAQAAPPAPTNVTPVMPQIPAGYALVPAQPGSAPGTVILTRAEAPKPSLTQMGHFQVGAVDVQLGGFFAAEGVFRSRNQVEDIQSNFNTGIPERNSPLYHEPEFIESSRQTRFTAILTAHPDDVTQILAYISTDFQGAAPTSNANESNSWVPRLREGYLTYSRSDLGIEVLAGQAYSLVSMTRFGMEPVNFNPPPTIDPTYVAGTFWARQPQIRLEKSFLDKQYWLAVSVENPQTVYSETSIPSTLGTLNVSNAGIGVDANGLSYSNNFAPDVVVKGVSDSKYAHLEAFGLGRLFNDRLSQLGTGESKTVFGGGAGGAALIRIIPNYLEFDADGMAGEGIGRYGTSQLPDATIGRDGQPVPLPEWGVEAGLIGHPIQTVDLYGFAGTEQTSRRFFDADVKGKETAYGYGNPLYSNEGCETELSTLTCTANTSGIVMGSVGAWWRFLKGPFGTMQVGVQYDYVHRSVFQGLGRTPETNDNFVFLSFRYFPWQ